MYRRGLTVYRGEDGAAVAGAASQVEAAAWRGSQATFWIRFRVELGWVFQGFVLEKGNFRSSSAALARPAF